MQFHKLNEATQKNIWYIDLDTLQTFVNCYEYQSYKLKNQEKAKKEHCGMEVRTISIGDNTIHYHDNELLQSLYQTTDAVFFRSLDNLSLFFKYYWN